MAKVQTTKVLETVKVDAKLTTKVLIDKIGRALGSPINGKQVDEEFDVTLTGNIEIREFNGQKSAYYTTKEGYSIRVNASFDPAIHKADKVMKCVCREMITEDRKIKFCAFVD
jgi:hypothetical protein